MTLQAPAPSPPPSRRSLPRQERGGSGSRRAGPVLGRSPLLPLLGPARRGSTRLPASCGWPGRALLGAEGPGCGHRRL